MENGFVLPLSSLQWRQTRLFIGSNSFHLHVRYDWNWVDHVSWCYLTLVIDLIGQLSRDIMGRLSAYPWWYWPLVSMVRFRNQKSQSTTVLFWTTFTRTIILNLFIPTLGWETLATNRFEKSGCRTSTRNDRSTKKGDLTQVLLSHALSAVISVRQTFGCVLSFGVTDVAHDGLLWNWFNESCLHWELFTFKQAIVWWSNRQIIALFRMLKCAIANFQCPKQP